MTTENEMKLDTVFKSVEDEAREATSGISHDMFLINPDFVLKVLNELCKKHGIELERLLTEMGMNVPKLKAFVINKSILEQIYTFNREFQIILYKMELSTKANTGEDVSTLDIRSMLGETMFSEEWLKLLDTIVLPYIRTYLDTGALDKDFLFRDKDGNVIEEKEVLNRIHRPEEGSGLTKEDMDKLSDDLDTALAEVSDTPEVVDENISLDHGDASVGHFTEEEVKEVSDKLQEENS